MGRTTILGVILSLAATFVFTTVSAGQADPGQRAGQPSNQTAAQGDNLIKSLENETEGPMTANRLAREDPRIAVPALTRAISKEFPAEVRWRAERALGAHGPEASQAVGMLIANLEDPNARVRAYAAYALGRIGGDAAKAAVPVLVKRMTDENAVVRRAALDALLALRPSRDVVVPLLAKALEDAEPRIVIAAVRTLASQGQAAVPVLIEALQNKKAAYWATVALEEMGPQAASAVEPLAALTTHNEPEMRLQSLMALAAIGEAAQSVAPQIIDRLNNDEMTGVRYAAAYALGKIGVETREAQAALISGMQSGDPMLAMISAWALAKLRPDDQQVAQQAAQRIVAGLQSQDPTVQAAAARALAESNLPTEITTPALEKALQSASPEVIAQAMDALAAQGARAVPRVVLGLKSEKLRPYAIAVLKQIGPEAAEAVPALVELLKNADRQARQEIQFTLAAIGAEAAPAVPQLINSLSSEDEGVKYSAIYALGRIGEQAHDAHANLLDFMTGEDERLQIAAVWAMARIDPGRPEIAETGVPVLVEALRADREIVRIEAAKTLATLGEMAKSALPALKQALHDESQAVQQAARQAIQRVEQQ